MSETQAPPCRRLGLQVFFTPAAVIPEIMLEASRDRRSESAIVERGDGSSEVVFVTVTGRFQRPQEDSMTVVVGGVWL